MAKKNNAERVTPMRVIEAARENVAARYRQTYHINAIMSGDWDNGFLVRNEVERITSLAPSEVEDQDAE